MSPNTCLYRHISKNVSHLCWSFRILAGRWPDDQRLCPSLKLFASDFVQNASNYIWPDLDLKIKPVQPVSVSLISFFLVDVLAYLADNKETRKLYGDIGPFVLIKDFACSCESPLTKEQCSRTVEI